MGELPRTRLTKELGSHRVTWNPTILSSNYFSDTTSIKLNVNIF